MNTLKQIYSVRATQIGENDACVIYSLTTGITKFSKIMTYEQANKRANEVNVKVALDKVAQAFKNYYR